MNKIQNEHHFQKLCDWCANKEPKLDTVIKEFGYPPFWHRDPNFATLILTILEQQVSLASAKATFNKLAEKIQPVNPHGILQLSDEEFRAMGFSRQKTLYTKILAKEIIEKRLNLDELNLWPEKKIRSTLIGLKGIGNWTIDMYVLMSLHFADIFPPGDLATIKAVYELNLVPPGFSKEEIKEYMKKFSPHQSAATYILWHYYIEKRNLVLE